MNNILTILLKNITNEHYKIIYGTALHNRFLTLSNLGNVLQIYRFGHSFRPEFLLFFIFIYRKVVSMY